MKMLRRSINILLISLLIGTFLYRSYTVDKIFGYNCFKWPTFSHDSLILAFILALYIISTFFKSVFIRMILRLISSFTFIIYVADIIIFKIFYLRLVTVDIFKYLREFKTLWYVFHNVLSLASKIQILAAISVFLFLLGYFMLQRLEIKKKARYYLSTAVVLLLIITVTAEDIEYVHSWAWKNIFEINYRNGIELPYSKEFKEDILSRKGYFLTENYVDIDPQRPNIIFICIESLSNYHSYFFSGLNNATPNLDRIAREGVSFIDFYANGFTTESGLISFFSGDIPLPKVREYMNDGFSYDGFYNKEYSLPRELKKHGYKSEFLTTGDLTFSNKGNWLKSLGFDYIEGSAHPYYKEYRRFHFNAAPDKALYMRLKERIKEQTHPYFIFVETVSTHHPFIDPESGSRFELDVFRYADRELGTFYQYLKREDFFSNGILIITSDHRSMTPLQRKEYEKYKIKALAKIPLVIVASEYDPKVIKTGFQQLDLYYSIVGLVSGRVAVSDFYGYLLGEDLIPPKYILYYRGDRRDIVSVYSGDNYCEIRLQGDKTAILSGSVKNAKVVIDRINYERLK
jgi:lipoteichoic acid synthase